MKKIMVITIVLAVLLGVAFNLSMSNDKTQEEVSLGFKNSGLPENVELDFANSGTPEYIELDFAIQVHQNTSN